MSEVMTGETMNEGHTSSEPIDLSEYENKNEPIDQEELLDALPEILRNFWGKFENPTEADRDRFYRYLKELDPQIKSEIIGERGYSSADYKTVYRPILEALMDKKLGDENSYIKKAGLALQYLRPHKTEGDIKDKQQTPDEKDEKETT